MNENNKKKLLYFVLKKSFEKDLDFLGEVLLCWEK